MRDTYLKSRTRQLGTFSIIGCGVGIILGVLWHYGYQWLGEIRLTAGVFAINESIWEHTKLLFWPMIIWSIFEYTLVGKRYDNYIVGKTMGILSGIAIIIAGYYTYSGIIGTNYLFMDIALFIVGVLVCQFISYKISRAYSLANKWINISCIVFMSVLGLMVVLWTFYPPQIPLFLDSTTKIYGILQ